MLKTWLGKKGYEVETASTNARARKLLTTRDFSLILSDLRLPDQDGIHLLSWLRDLQKATPVIIMTSYAEIQGAVLAMKEGAADYVFQTCTAGRTSEKDQGSNLTGEQGCCYTQGKQGKLCHTEFSGRRERSSPPALQLRQPGCSDQMSVLINGASGTGKEYVAHRIHQLSKRADKPFIAIDCGSIPKDLAASEFFGHVKGSFTGALTDKVGALKKPMEELFFWMK